jgi:hypothetical protein
LRTLKDGRQVEELDQPVTLTITTYCPEKWLLIDNETGEQYTGHIDPSLGNSWRKLNK